MVSYSTILHRALLSNNLLISTQWRNAEIDKGSFQHSTTLWKLQIQLKRLSEKFWVAYKHHYGVFCNCLILREASMAAPEVPNKLQFNLIEGATNTYI